MGKEILTEQYTTVPEANYGRLRRIISDVAPDEISLRALHALLRTSVATRIAPWRLVSLRDGTDSPSLNEALRLDKGINTMKDVPLPYEWILGFSGYRRVAEDPGLPSPEHNVLS